MLGHKNCYAKPLKRALAAKAATGDAELRIVVSQFRL
jgi:hypothetical protein